MGMAVFAVLIIVLLARSGTAYVAAEPPFGGPALPGKFAPHPLANPLRIADGPLIASPLGSGLVHLLPGSSLNIPATLDQTEAVRRRLDAAGDLARDVSWMTLAAIALAAAVAGHVMRCMVPGLTKRGGMWVSFFAAMALIIVSPPGSALAVAEILGLACALAGACLVMFGAAQGAVIGGGVLLAMASAFSPTWWPWSILCGLLLLTSSKNTHLAGIRWASIAAGVAVAGILVVAGGASSAAARGWPAVMPIASGGTLSWSFEFGVPGRPIFTPYLLILASAAVALLFALPWLSINAGIAMRVLILGVGLAAVHAIAALVPIPEATALAAGQVGLLVAFSTAAFLGRREDVPTLSTGPTLGLLGGVGLLAVIVAIGQPAGPRAVRLLYGMDKDTTPQPERAFIAFEAVLRDSAVMADSKTRDAMRTEADKLLVRSLEDHLALSREGTKVPSFLPPEAFALNVQISIRRGETDVAIAILKELEKSDPTNSGHLLVQAMLLVKSGRAQEAEAALKRGIELAGSAQPALLLAQEAAKNGDTESAAALLKIFEQTPNVTEAQLLEARMLRGRLLAMEKKWDEAALAIEPMLQMDGQQDNARAMLRELEARRLNMENLKKYSRQPGEPETIPTWNDVLRSALARHWKAQDWVSARALLDAWIAALPAGAERAQPLILRGQLSLRQERPADGLKDLQQAKTDAPRDATAVKALAEAYVRLEFGDEAEATLAEAVGLFPNDIPMLALYVDFMAKRNKANAALATLESIVNGDPPPTRPEPYMFLGSLSAYLGLHRDAAEAYRKALALVPDDARISLRLAQSLARTPEHEKGAELYVDLLKKEPTNPAYYMGLADLFAINGDLESAFATLERGVSNLRQHAAPLLVKGAQIALVAKRIDLAKSSLEKALKIEPENEQAKTLLTQVTAAESNIQRLLELQKAAQAATPTLDLPGAPADATPIEDTATSPTLFDPVFETE